MNSEAQLEYGLQLWNKLNKETQFFQSGSFLGLLAINLGQPKTALEILESTKQSHVTPVFIRLIALADCGYFAEATKLIEERKKNFPKSKIYASVVEKIGEILKKYPTTEEKRNFSKLLDTIPLHEQKYSIDKIICFPIDPTRGLTPQYCSPNYIGPRYKKNR
ncbi:uncharacterized protein LOC116337831 [Contarinia nasturtii]|uniref:uncharacterized protein LOC116337831 n=1 Tax=Contarinia nasturtii TaxID=265458 RepID=UPI0012D3EC90|nr:uncharacterized protein LOC116337831 [Contarinia nasturtii]